MSPFHNPSHRVGSAHAKDSSGIGGRRLLPRDESRKRSCARFSRPGRLPRILSVILPGLPAPPDANLVPRPANWLEWVNQPQSQEEVDAIRNSIARGTPLGQEQWTREIADTLDLQSTLRPRGRPTKRGHSTFPFCAQESCTYLTSCSE